MSELTQSDWDWLQKLATIYSRPTAQTIPTDVLVRLTDAGYVRNNNEGQIAITSAGRKALKARDSGEEY